MNTVSVVWEITRLCNLKCRHCASVAGLPREEELSTEEALSLISQFHCIGVHSVCLFGGEAILRPDWEILAASLKEHGIEVSLATNGYAFNQGLAERLLNLGISSIGISLDSGDAESHDKLRGRKGAHQRAIEAISLINSMPFKECTVITSVSKLNLNSLSSILEILVQIANGSMWMINMASCHNETRMDMNDVLGFDDYLQLATWINTMRPKYLNQIDITGTHDLGYFSYRFPHLHNFEWKGCRAGIDTLGIHSNGDVKGCLILPDQFIEGNIRKESLEKIWFDPKRFVINRHFHEDMLEGECKGCLFGHVCQGGCKDIAVSTTGSPYNYPYCFYRYESQSVREIKTKFP